MQRIILRNTFHETTCKIDIPDDDELPRTLRQATVAKVKRELCGHEGCCCGTIRGHQYQPDGSEVIFYGDGDPTTGMPSWTIEEIVEFARD